MLSREPDQVFLDADGLKEIVGLPASAEELFVLDQWTAPEMEEPASSDEDLVLALEALRERRAITAALHPKSPETYLHERIDLPGGWGANW